MSSAEPPRGRAQKSIALLGKDPELKSRIEGFVLKNHKAVSRRFFDFTLKENESFRIINSPDVLDEKCLHEKIIDLMALSDPGPDLFMLALEPEVSEHVKEARAQISKLQEIFGQAVRNHLVIIVENSETGKDLSSYCEGKFNIQVVSENLPDQCEEWLLRQPYEFDSKSYFQNAVKRRKAYLERHECLPDHIEGRDVPLQSSPQRSPPQRDLGNGQGGAGPETTIVLLGNTGTGKSASANTILAAGSPQSALSNTLSRRPQLDPSQQFESCPSSTPVTTKCEVKTAQICGTQVRVVDTPDFFYEEERVNWAEIGECKKLCQPWRCVVLLVVQLGRFTEEESEILEKLEEHLGWQIREKTIVLFTHGEDFSDSLKRFIGERSRLSHIVKACGNRYHVFQNTVKDSRQVLALFRNFPEMFPDFTEKPSAQCSLF